jgi:phage tail-like protein
MGQLFLPHKNIIATSFDKLSIAKLTIQGKFVMSAQKRESTQRKDPYGNYRFKVEINGITQAGFSEVIIPDSSNQVIEVREGTSPTFVRKQPGLAAYGNLILKWGLTASMELYNWRKAVEQGLVSTSRKNISVIVVDEEGNDAARWDFTNAWPSKYKAPDLNAKGNDIAIETLEIVFETMQRVK